MRNLPFIVQTCDAGKHRRKDRPNGGMYIGEGEVSLTIAAMQPQETLVVRSKKVGMPSKKPPKESFGCSFDLFFGCPSYKECSTTLVVCTCPGYHYGVVEKKQKNRLAEQ